jgi:hypothetical protein
MSCGEQAHQFCLYDIGVLVFIDHDVAVSVGKTPPHIVVKVQQLGQPKQQIVVIEHAAFTLVAVILVRQSNQLTFMFEQMRKIDLELLFERSILVARHADGFGDSAFLRETPLFRAKPHPAPHQIDNVLHV